MVPSLIFIFLAFHSLLDLFDFLTSLLIGQHHFLICHVVLTCGLNNIDNSDCVGGGGGGFLDRIRIDSVMYFQCGLYIFGGATFFLLTEY